MPSLGSSSRLWITAVVLLGAFILLQTTGHGESVVPRQPPREFPYKLSSWSGEEHPLQNDIVNAVGMTDYTNRVYVESGAAPIQLYIGYYASQKTGDTIHSPKNCLPGAGWQPIKIGEASIAVSAGRKIAVNEYVIQQDLNKELVFYWYQGRGRVIASEYVGKFWMVADSITRNRTDGALIRLITSMSDGEKQALARLTSFVQDSFPDIERLIPQ
jgi:EpsI family protein